MADLILPDRSIYWITMPFWPWEEPKEEPYRREEPYQGTHKYLGQGRVQTRNSKVPFQSGTTRQHGDDSKGESSSSSKNEGCGKEASRGKEIGCRSTEVHRCQEDWLQTSHEASCTTCGAAYPVRRTTKSFWRWFWEAEPRKDADVFYASLVFSAVQFAVMCMAWFYIMFNTSSLTSPRPLAFVLLVLSVFWVASVCVRFHFLYERYATWSKSNMSVKVLSGDKLAQLPV